MSRRIITLVVMALFFVVLAGCKKDKTYDAKVKLNRLQNIRFDAAGKATDMDIELDWFQCPGTQIEVIRGDAAFSECMKKYKVGDEVAVKIRYQWDPHGYYDWDITDMGGCKRPPDPEDLSSFDTVQECEPIVVNGVNEGFHCNRIPQKELLKKCPWFGRN